MIITDSQKKILFVTCRIPYPLDDGWKIRCFHLMKSFTEHGWVVDLLTFLPSGMDDTSVGGLARICREIYTAPRQKSYAPSDLLQGLLTSIPFPVLNYTTPKMSKLASEVVRQKNHYDLIQIEDIMMCNNLVDTSGEKIVLDMHNVQSELMRRYALTERNFFRKKYAQVTAEKLVRYEKRLGSTFKMIFVCSEEDRQIVLRNSPTIPVDIIPNGVNSDFFSSGSQSQELDRIVFIGDLGYHANRVGVRFLVEDIFPRVRQRCPSVQLVIVGKNPSLQISAYADDSVIVTGMVVDVRPFLESAKVVVVPLLSGGGTRLKILEAMAMGKAVVSTSIGCEGIPAQHGKHIILADTSESFAEEVCKLCNDEGRRFTLGEDARSFVKAGFDWNAIGDRLFQVASSLV